VASTRQRAGDFGRAFGTLSLASGVAGDAGGTQGPSTAEHDAKSASRSFARDDNGADARMRTVVKSALSHAAFASLRSRGGRMRPPLP